MKILLECKQPIPDFLQSYKPETELLDFEDDTDEEGDDKGADKEDANQEESNGAWGGISMEPTEEVEANTADDIPDW